MVAAGSEDCIVDFYSFDTEKGKMDRNGYCSQVPGSILQLDWSNDSKFIKVNTNSYQYVVYDAPGGNEVKDKTEIENVVWNQWSSIYGEEVVGIWPSDSKQDFVNCAHLAPYASKLATGDDSGYIKLFTFPCVEKNV